MTHGLMFHYFHSDEIPRTQGSISGDTFERILDNYAKDYHLLAAEEYLNKAILHTLRPEDVCITFDDGLYSQYCVADKILRKKGLTAFYFIYSSPMEGIFEKIELYRTLRNKYDTMNAFYKDFFDTLVEYGVKKGINYKALIESENAKNYYIQYGYYTKNDRIFRYLRNEILKESYDLIMNKLMKKRGFVPEVECKKIWIDSEQLKDMKEYGDIIGLHSHSHPTSLNGLSYDDKKREYASNKMFLEKAINFWGGGSEKCILSM